MKYGKLWWFALIAKRSIYVKFQPTGRDFVSCAELKLREQRKAEAQLQREIKERQLQEVRSLPC